MLIQLNTDNHVDANDPVVRHTESDLERTLQRFASEITRIEVHFQDENAAKAGDLDKRCLLEARIRGHEPMAVSNKAATLTAAYTGARDKLTRALDNKFAKLREPVRRDPFDNPDLPL